MLSVPERSAPGGSRGPECSPFSLTTSAVGNAESPHSRRPMKVALTPLEFARRARRLFGSREAVVDGDLRLTYEQFFERCDRWSAALQRLGVRAGDRVAYIAPNTHAQLESFYAVPQIGAVLVPINYRLNVAALA